MTAEPTPSLRAALDEVRTALLRPESLARAVAAGKRKGTSPRWRRAEIRPVQLGEGLRLQITTYDDTQAHTANHRPGAEADEAVTALLEEPFGNWHVETDAVTLQVRVSKRGEAFVHREESTAPAPASRAHDRRKSRLIEEDDPLLIALGISSADGRVRAARRAKYRQVEEFAKLLDGTVAEALETGRLRRPTAEEPLRVVDLGCGNAYLTFAAQRVLAGVRDLPVALTGVDVKEQSRRHNTEVAAELGVAADFVVGSIADAQVDPAPEVVLALHACDTATDDALARAVAWGAPVILAAPCCHHDVAAQLRTADAPVPYGLLTRHGILRERLADTLTDAVRAALLRRAGYRVEVVEFVGSEHTPRNTLLRATYTGAGGEREAQEYAALVAQWGIRPRLGELLGA